MKYIIELTKKQVASLLGQKKKRNTKKGRPSKYPDVTELRFYESNKSNSKLIKALLDAGIKTSKQLSTYTKVELMSLKGVAEKSVQRIEEALNKFGLKLKK